MKIKVLKHIGIKPNIDDDFQKVVNYYNSDFVKQYINEPIEFKIENTNLDIKEVFKLIVSEKEYDVVMFIYEMGTFAKYGECFPTGGKIGIYLSVNQIEDNIDYTWKIMAHEILHAIVYKTIKEKQVFIPNLLDNSLPTPYYKNDDPYATDGNFSQQLNVLKQFYKKGYKYFKPNTDPKMIGIKHEVMLILDELRERCGFPIIITSGLRTKEENDKLPNAVEDSAHLLGLAADIYCIDNARRDKILNILKDLGVKRRGIGTTFIHLDIDISKPQSVVWIYK